MFLEKQVGQSQRLFLILDNKDHNLNLNILESFFKSMHRMIIGMSISILQPQHKHSANPVFTIWIVLYMFQNHTRALHIHVSEATWALLMFCNKQKIKLYWHVRRLATFSHTIISSTDWNAVEPRNVPRLCYMKSLIYIGDIYICICMYVCVYYSQSWCACVDITTT